MNIPRLSSFSFLFHFNHARPGSLFSVAFLRLFIKKVRLHPTCPTAKLRWSYMCLGKSYFWINWFDNWGKATALSLPPMMLRLFRRNCVFFGELNDNMFLRSKSAICSFTLVFIFYLILYLLGFFDCYPSFFRLTWSFRIDWAFSRDATT